MSSLLEEISRNLTRPLKLFEGSSKVQTLQSDLYDADDLSNLLTTINNSDQHIRYMVNAAGYFNPKPFTLNTIMRRLRSIRQRSIGLDILFPRPLPNNMIINGGGSIVHIGSMWAKQAIKATPSSAYSMAKAGLHALTSTYGDGT